MIEEAKKKAAAAENMTSDTLDKLNAIKKEIDKIKVTPVDSNLGNILDNVDKSGENLKNVVTLHICRIKSMAF